MSVWLGREPNQVTTTRQNERDNALEARSAAPVSPLVETLDDAMRAHILEALRATNWVLGGPYGAAARLGMKRTTLASRMEKLGIVRQHGIMSQ